MPVSRQAVLCNDSATGKPCLDQFWDGWGAHLDFTPSRPQVVAKRCQQQVLGFGIDTAWNDNNEYEIWSESGQSHGGDGGEGNAKPIPIHRSRSLHALLMTQATYEAQAEQPNARLHRHPRRPAGHPALRQTWSGDTRRAGTMRWNQRMALTMTFPACSA